ncbi:probable BOI-related E3 ubiquitin-protein ligase 3 [Neltuma alba]|uniref:probable BOI-related E3 ubiquitin-protein ligase 3 n=1 Tax=Neltuma alba TaxID=207710 RepID=UPI0010A3C589|nr:probable BOI-related E3 ubiquitin-protein ligase 3 [Prosopis alba]
MAVEAHHLNQFSSQLLANRDIVGSVQPSMNLYSAQMNAYNSSLLPLSGTTTATDCNPLLPAPYNSLIVDSLPQKTPIKSDSGLSHNLPLESRKRSRDSMNYPLLSCKNTADNDEACAAFSFLGQDISLQIHRQQLDVDRLIAHHMENVRADLEEKRKRQARRILEAIEAGMMKRLRAKEEEMAKIGKLNWALEEKVKSLCVENQIWRDLAQTNEATANALRTNLEQVLAQFRDERRLNYDDGATVVPAGAELMDDAQSCCGSTGGVDVDDLRDDGGSDREGWRRLGVGTEEKGEEEEGKRRIKGGMMKSSGRMCRKCGKEESCVLMLPCRHLCLCTVCGSSLNYCPICKSFKTGSVHVNMS